ncbi:hypothetical protein [Nitrospira sp. Kam-Ns4a]
MVRFFQRSVAVLLAVWLLSVGALAYGQMVQHAVQHAHHKAATHATAICSWVCSAGQVLEGPAIPLHVAIGPLTVASLPPGAHWASAVRVVSPSRGPPLVSA